MTIVDDPSYGFVRHEPVRRRPGRTAPPEVPLCQSTTRCWTCGHSCAGIVALVHHVADGLCRPHRRNR